MSKRANPTAVGFFVTGAILIALASVVLLGTEGLFDRKVRFITYFQQDANGLNEGADVKIGGVKIGTVESIQILTDAQNRQKLIPVVTEISEQKIAAATGNPSAATKLNVQQVLDQGLKASLKAESLVTGKLYVDLDVRPFSEGFVYEGPTNPGLEDLTQIPSVSGTIDIVMNSMAESLEKISKIDMEGISRDLLTLITDVSRKVNDIDTAAISDSTVALLEEGRALVGNEDLKSALANLDSSMQKLDDSMSEVQEIATTLNERVGPITEKTELALDSASETFDRAALAVDDIRTAAANVGSFAAPNSPVNIRLNRVLAELETTTRSIRELSDYLRRNPNALITGRKNAR